MSGAESIAHPEYVHLRTPRFAPARRKRFAPATNSCVFTSARSTVSRQGVERVELGIVRSLNSMSSCRPSLRPALCAKSAHHPSPPTAHDSDASLRPFFDRRYGFRRICYPHPESLPPLCVAVSVDLLFAHCITPVNPLYIQAPLCPVFAKPQTPRF